MARKATIKLRQDTYENFEADASGDGILQGEVVYLTDKKALVVGDGVNGVAGHPTIRPVGNYHNTEVDGWTVTKDNNDIERKFFKDDFSVDSSDNYILQDTTECDPSGWGTGTVTLAYRAATALNFCISKRLCNPDRVDISMSAGWGGITYNYVDNSNFECIYLRPDTEENWTLVRHVKMVNGGETATDLRVYNFSYTFPVNISFRNDGTSVKVYINNVAKRTVPNTTITGYCGFGAKDQNGQYGSYGAYTSFTQYPSISYSDDFTSDTTERYQAVTGTVTYDDANKRMNVTTAAGANGKASGRLKSYKFCEGSQIYDVLLPTGADGDFICMVTHTTNGAMDNGIGVGLQSDGAGNWNLATLSGTTVTEGADSGLDDTDVARIEIEKDLSGAYWYYIYDAAGAKPTTATGKLYTTKSEGYTGWYANGNSKTYAIDNISIRAESIVGRTNVQVTEDVFNSVTGEIEARTYFKPIHRGAMLETYHDGTQEVVGTTFIDDFNWDRSAETSYYYRFEVDTINGCLKNTGSSAYWIYKGVQFCGKNSPFVIGFDISFADVTDGGDRISIGFATGTDATFGYNQTLGIFAHGFYKIGAGSATGPYPMTAGVTYRHLYVCDGIRSYLYRDGVLLFSSTDLFTETAGFLGITHYSMGSTRTPIISNLFVIAASPDATNGIAACIPPVGGGARYGVQEGASIEFTNKALRGDYDFTTCVKTTVPSAIAHNEMYFGNATDTSAITEDTTTTKDLPIESTSYLDFEQPIVLNYDDRGDTISVGVRKHTSNSTDTDPATYIDFMAVVPTKEVI